MKVATRTARRYHDIFEMWPDEAAGLRMVVMARQTGTLVGVYHAGDAGLESDEPESNWFATVCEEHGTLVLHPTLTLARSHAPDPRAWCGVCGGSDD